MNRTWLLAAALLYSRIVYGAGPMPSEQVNGIVAKYCGVCHSDAVRNGALTLEPFDGANIAPSLAAMMISKLNNGALGAAGNGVPPADQEKSFTETLLAASQGATAWHVSPWRDAATKAPLITASVLRELPKRANTPGIVSWRLVLACNPATHEGEMQLAWSPQPARGTLQLTLDGKEPVSYKVEGTEKMGNGSAVTSGPAALSLFHTDGSKPILLPSKSLTATGLFPGETVEFSFDDFPGSARQSLKGCFR